MPKFMFVTFCECFSWTCAQFCPSDNLTGQSKLLFWECWVHCTGHPPGLPLNFVLNSFGSVTLQGRYAQFYTGHARLFLFSFYFLVTLQQCAITQLKLSLLFKPFLKKRHISGRENNFFNFKDKIHQRVPNFSQQYFNSELYCFQNLKMVKNYFL